MIRKAYTYVRSDGKVVHVPAKKMHGSRSKSKVRIGPLRKGLLAQYGYSNVKNMSSSNRHSALNKAVQNLGRTHVIKSLVAASTYSKRKSPHSSEIFRENMNYVR